MARLWLGPNGHMADKGVLARGCPDFVGKQTCFGRLTEMKRAKCADRCDCRFVFLELYLRRINHRPQCGANHRNPNDVEVDQHRNYGASHGQPDAKENRYPCFHNDVMSGDT